MEAIKFSKHRLSLSSKANSTLLEEIQIATGLEGYDFMDDQFTIKLEAYILAAQEEIKEVVKYDKPQSFWNWILRRPQKFIFTINCKEVFLNPPKLEPGKSVMFYIQE